MGITQLLAIYGAALSTAVFVWNIRGSRANLRARIVHALEDTEDGYLSGIRVEVQNPSLHTAHLNSVMLMYPFRKAPVWEHVNHLIKYRTFPTRQGWCHTSLSNYGVEAGCPISIDPHKSHPIFIPDSVLNEIREESIKPVLKVVVQDALWRNRYSKAFNYGYGINVLEEVTSD